MTHHTKLLAMAVALGLAACNPAPDADQDPQQQARTPSGVAETATPVADPVERAPALPMPRYRFRNCAS